MSISYKYIMDEEKKINIRNIITNTIVGVLVIIVSLMVIISLITIMRPILDDKTNKVDTSNYINKIEEAMVMIYSNYVDDIDMETLVQGAINGMSKVTEDPYTRYVSQDEYDKMLISGNEKYGGLGIHIIYDEEKQGIIVLSVMPESPAFKEGILSGDVIKKVDGVDVNYDNYYECVDAIKGEENTKVTLTIKRDNETFTETYTRKIVISNNVESKKINNDIGYIKILSFDNNVANQFKAQYKALRKENVSSLILDLRNNPGGLLNETVDIAKQILPKGEIVKLVYKNKPDKIYYADGQSKIDIPLIVLVNENSASASEILAGAIKDSNVGKLIGIKTYGKGIVQSIERLTGSGAISITTSKYYTASGVEIHKNGIIPDYEIQLDKQYNGKHYIPEDKDFQLQKAIELLNP